VSCTVIQRRLLSAEQPEHPSAEILSHLAHCPSCRAWQRRLVQMERQLPLLPIPPSTGKEQFLQRLLGTPGRETAGHTIADPATLWRNVSIPGRKERALQKVSLAFALAASLLVFALIWWAWPRGTAPVSDILRQEQARLDVLRQEQARLEQRLHTSLQANTPKERVLRLARLAEEIHGEARKLVENSDKLEQRAQFYANVVGEHLIEQARQLPAQDRPAVVNEVAKALSQAESEASRWGSQLQTTAPRSAASFEQIALISRKSERVLRALLNG
jgi:hypothetical protein